MNLRRQVRTWLGLSGGESASAAGHLRTRRLLATGSASVVVQFIGVTTTLVVTPLLVRGLGAVQFGIYATIASTVSWLGLAQIGLTPSVLNELSTEKALKSPRSGAVAVSSATAIQVVISGALLAGLVATAPFVSWADAFNAPTALESAASTAALILFTTFIVQIPLGVGKVAFEAHQQGYIAQGWQLGSYLLRLGFVVVVVTMGGSLPMVALAITLPAVLAQLGQYGHAFWGAYPEWRPRATLASWRVGRALLGVGADFLILSIAGLVIAATDNLVIAHVVGPAAVTPYAVTFTVTQLPTVFTLLILQAAWPAYREASTTDIPWLLQMHRRIRRMSIGVPLLAGVVFLFVGRDFIELWAGSEAVPTRSVLAWLVAVAAIQGVLLPAGRMLTVLGATRTNALLGATNAAINLPLSIMLANSSGVAGVAAGTAVGYLSVGWILLVACNRRLKEMKSK